MPQRADDHRSLIVLGATGSIGANTLEVVAHLNDVGDTRFEIVGLAACANADALIEQAKRFNVTNLAIADPDKAEALRTALPDANIFVGNDAAEQLVEAVDATDLAAAVVGAAGLRATCAGIRKGMRISLSNKETLVAGGALVTPLIEKHHAQLLPVDSEHSAIFQCIEARKEQSEINRIVLTASGGPFRNAAKDDIDGATVEDALNHPTWTMGQKITIDSATMMNKALEIIEAHWLFGLPAEKIEVIVHPQSIVHSFVEFADHSVLAQLGPPDMRTPIQYALAYPRRLAGCGRAMDFTALSELNFQQPDFDRFPALRLAYDVIAAGGTAGAVLNAANEAAVHAFLARRIRFGRITDLVADALRAIPPSAAESLDDVLEADRQARAYVHEQIDGKNVENARMANARMSNRSAPSPPGRGLG